MATKIMRKKTLKRKSKSPLPKKTEVASPIIITPPITEVLPKIVAPPSKPQPLRMQLTYKNHFQFGYDGVPFIFRENSKQRWWVNYGRCRRWAYDWRSECIMAAREIRAATDQELWVCFSGGIDSEVVAESFRFARIPFRAAIMRFTNDQNIQDISWAIAYCEKHDIPYELFNINIIDFFESGEMMHFADLTQCPTPQLPSSMKLMELIAKRGGYPILGSAECYLARHQHGWYMYEREKIASLYRYLLKTGYPGQAGFFQWNPEIMYSFLVDPTIRKLTENKLPRHSDSYYIKAEIYSDYWKLQPRPKYTGFEKIMRLDNKWRPILEQKYGYCNEQVYIGYHDLVKRLAYTETLPGLVNYKPQLEALA